VLANYSQYSSRYDKLLAGEVPNIFNPEYAGGALMDINYYNVYLTVALYGKPEQAVYHPNLYQGKYDTSGVVHLQYPGFVAECAGAKDTWGVNAYQIEGEQGFLYVRDGSNGLAEIRIVTKNSDDTINLQSNPDRWFYEVQALTGLMLREDYDSVYARLDMMQDAVETTEKARKNAGLFFPGD
jgi:predicted dehydrogenase